MAATTSNCMGLVVRWHCLYHNVCYTCPSPSLPWVLRIVLRRSKTWAESGACVANIVIHAARQAPVHPMQTFGENEVILQGHWHLHALLLRAMQKVWWHEVEGHLPSVDGQATVRSGPQSRMLSAYRGPGRPSSCATASFLQATHCTMRVCSPSVRHVLCSCFSSTSTLLRVSGYIRPVQLFPPQVGRGLCQGRHLQDKTHTISLRVHPQGLTRIGADCISVSRHNIAP